MSRITDPTALADQLKAATNQTRQLAARLLADGLAERHQVVPAWQAEQVARLHTAIQNGTARGCRHLAGGPRLTLAAAWAPGILACTACVSLLTPTPEDEQRCDACRTHHQVLTAGTVMTGPLLLLYTLCPACHHRHGGTPTGPTDTNHRPSRPRRRDGRHRPCRRR
jgi:hypothetical protein